MTATVELVPATQVQQPLLANLLQLYMHDFGEFTSVELGSDGRYEYTPLPLYWLETSRYPFLAAVNGRWAGFVFIRQIHEPESDEPMRDMTEFFVVRAYRRRGIGTRMAHLAFEAFPGTWQVRVMQSNQAATHFWQRAIESFTGCSVAPVLQQIDGSPWSVFNFESKA